MKPFFLVIEFEMQQSGVPFVYIYICYYVSIHICNIRSNGPLRSDLCNFEKREKAKKRIKVKKENNPERRFVGFTANQTETLSDVWYKWNV